MKNLILSVLLSIAIINCGVVTEKETTFSKKYSLFGKNVDIAFNECSLNEMTVYVNEAYSDEFLYLSITIIGTTICDEDLTLEKIYIIFTNESYFVGDAQRIKAPFCLDHIYYRSTVPFWEKSGFCN